jgi:hypothetical protein
MGSLFRKKPPEPVFDPNPAEVDYMPARPYRVVHADLPFYSDPKCLIEVEGARLVVLECEDPEQTLRPRECMPVTRAYRQGQMVGWDLNNKKLWETSYYRNPETGEPERAWSQSVEFIGPVVKVAPGAAPGARPDPRAGRR